MAAPADHLLGRLDKEPHQLPRTGRRKRLGSSTGSCLVQSGNFDQGPGDLVCVDGGLNTFLNRKFNSSLNAPLEIFLEAIGNRHGIRTLRLVLMLMLYVRWNVIDGYSKN